MHRADKQFADMQLASRILEQGGEILQAARGFKQCGVTVISNDPVIVLQYEQRLFVRRKIRGIRKRSPNPFEFLFGAHDFFVRNVLEGA